MQRQRADNGVPVFPANFSWKGLCMSEGACSECSSQRKCLALEIVVLKLVLIDHAMTCLHSDFAVSK